jgi:hypothetical protein
VEFQEVWVLLVCRVLLVLQVWSVQLGKMDFKALLECQEVQAVWA